MATYTWNTSTSNASWNTLSNWLVGGAIPSVRPTINDDVVIVRDIAATTYVYAPPASISAKSISISDVSPVSHNWGIVDNNTGDLNPPYNTTWLFPAAGGVINVPNTGAAPYGLSRSIISINMGDSTCGDLRKTGPGTLQLYYGSTHGFSGNFYIDEGHVQFGLNGGNISIGTGTIFLANGASIGNFNSLDAGTLDNNVTVAAGATASIIQNASSATGGMRLAGTLNVPSGTTLNWEQVAAANHYINGPFIGSGTINRNGAISTSASRRVIINGAKLFSGTWRNLGAVTNPSFDALRNAIFEPGDGTLYLSSVTDLYFGGLTGARDLTFFIAAGSSPTNLYLGGVDVSQSNVYWSGNFTTNIGVIKQNTGNQTFAGGSSVRTTAATSVSGGGAITLTQGTALYAAGATGTTTLSDSGTQLRLFGSITTPSGAGLTLGQGTGIRSISSTPSHGGPITLSGDASFEADSATTLTIPSLNLNGRIATITGSGTVSWTGTLTNGAISSALIYGNLNLSSISATLFRAYGQGTLTGNINIASAGELIAGNYEGGKTLTITGNVTTSGAISLICGGVTGGVASKVAVGGTFNAGGTQMVVKGYGSGWQTNTEYVVGTYGSGTPSVNTTAGSWSALSNTRVGNGTVRVDTTNKQILLTPAALSNISNTWNGGVAGSWYAGQPSGWISSSIAQSFENNDAVTFSGAQSTTTATLASNVTMASLSILNTTNVARSQTITGSSAITNNGALSITNSGTSTQDVYLYATGTHSSISISNGASGAGTTLHINSINAIGGSATIAFNNSIVKYVGSTATLNKNFTLTNNATLDSSGTGILTWSGVSSIASGTKILTLTGVTSGIVSNILTNSSGVLALTKTGNNTWTLSSANTHSGTNTISAGKLVVSKKTGLGTGPVTISASLQFTDTTTDVTKLASIGSFTSNGGRLILGA